MIDMEIPWARSSSAISRINAGAQAHELSRQREEQSFEQRRSREQAQGVDRALREGIGAVYAQPGPAAPADPVAAPVQVTPPITPSVPGGEVISPELLPSGASSSASPAAVAGNAPNPAIQGVNRPAIAGISANPMMTRLAQTPGAGQTMVGMHQRNEQRTERQERLKQQAEIQVIKALHNGEGPVAEAIARQYQINIPPEVLQSQQFQGEMKQVGTWIKGMGITDDGMAAQLTMNYLKAKQGGADPRTALQTAIEQTKAPAAKGSTPKRRWDSTRGAWIEEPSEENAQGQALVPANLPARQVSRGGGGGRGGAGAGGGETGTQKNWKTATQAYVEAGYDPKVARLMAINKGFAVTPQLVQRQAQHVMNTNKDARGRSTVTYEDAMQRAQRMLSSVPIAPAAAPPQRPPIGGFGERPPLTSFERAPGK